MTSETRTFSDPNNAALNGVSETLAYDYYFGGLLKKITDSTGMAINYGYDSSGRLNGVTGSGNLYANVSTYASSFQYRAFGGLKSVTDGTNHVTTVAYNARLQPTEFNISGNVVHQTYDHYDDGRMSFVHNTMDPNFDRSYAYDHAGRLIENKTERSGARRRIGLFLLCRWPIKVRDRLLWPIILFVQRTRQGL
jgi:uncharacterized protein RhaS with RHS repeats